MACFGCGTYLDPDGACRNCADAKTFWDAVGRDDRQAAQHAEANRLVTADQSAEPSEAPSRFAATLLRRSQLALIPPIEPLIEGVLSLRTAAVLFGPTGAGKTFVALSWACSVGTGKPWLGRPVVRAPVLYVVGEGASGLDHRVSAWEYAWGTTVTDDDVIFSVKPNSLSDMGTWHQMGKEAEALGARFIVLDTFSSLAYDADEVKDAPVVMRRLSDLAAAIDGTALLVHHPGWGDAERVRGGSQLESNADEVLRLAGNGASDLVEMTRKKVKEGQSGERIWLRRKTIDLGAGQSSVVIEEANRSERQALVADAAVDALREVFGNTPASKAQLRDALIERLGLSRTTAYEHVNRLESGGSLVRSGGTDNRPLYEVSRS
jgi:hypothetical protein